MADRSAVLSTVEAEDTAATAEATQAAGVWWRFPRRRLLWRRVRPGRFLWRRLLRRRSVLRPGVRFLRSVLVALQRLRLSVLLLRAAYRDHTGTHSASARLSDPAAGASAAGQLVSLFGSGRLLPLCPGVQRSMAGGSGQPARRAAGLISRLSSPAAVFFEPRHDLDEIARLVPVIELALENPVPAILHRARGSGQREQIGAFGHSRASAGLDR